MSKFAVMLFLVFNLQLFCDVLEINTNNKNNLYSEKILGNFKQIKIPGYPNAFNPSLLANENGFLLAFRYCPNVSHFESYIGIVQLDKSCNIISKPEILTNRPEGSNIVSRLQDARLFELNGQIYVVYNDNLDLVYPTPNCRKDMFIAKLSVVDGHYQLSPALKVIYNDKYQSQLVQKNWSPFVWNDTLLFSYYINPHEVILPNLLTGNSSLLNITAFNHENWKWGQIKGGTPAIPIDDNQYLAFFHSTLYNKGIRNYYVGAYTFAGNPPFNLTAVSPRPFNNEIFYDDPVNKKRSIFPGGIAISDNYVHMAFGKDNKEVWVVRFNKKRLLQTLEPVQ